MPKEKKDNKNQQEEVSEKETLPAQQENASLPSSPDSEEIFDEEKAQAINLLARTLAHSKRVESHASKLFQKLKSVHELPDEYNKLLCTAAYLHDIGWIYGQNSHHKSSAKIILNYLKDKEFIPSDENIDSAVKEELDKVLKKHLGKVDKQAGKMIALIARYHRKSEPTQRHSAYKKLSKENQKIVQKLSSIIRIADALDYSHMAMVKDIDISVEDKNVVLVLNCESACSAEKERVDYKKKLFQETFKRLLICQVNRKKWKK